VPRIPLEQQSDPEHESPGMTPLSYSFKDEIERAVKAILGPVPPPDYEAGRKLSQADPRTPQGGVDIVSEAGKGVLKNAANAAIFGASMHPAALPFTLLTVADELSKDPETAPYAEPYLQAKWIGDAKDLARLRTLMGPKLYDLLEQRTANIRFVPHGDTADIGRRSYGAWVQREPAGDVMTASGNKAMHKLAMNPSIWDEFLADPHAEARLKAMSYMNPALARIVGTAPVHEGMHMAAGTAPSYERALAKKGMRVETHPSGHNKGYYPQARGEREAEINERLGKHRERLETPMKHRGIRPWEKNEPAEMRQARGTDYDPELVGLSKLYERHGDDKTIALGELLIQAMAEKYGRKHAAPIVQDAIKSAEQQRYLPLHGSLRWQHEKRGGLDVKAIREFLQREEEYRPDDVAAFRRRANESK
jgi:hypothetical protein